MCYLTFDLGVKVTQNGNTNVVTSNFAIQEFHRRFVLPPVDKAANNVVVV